MISSEQSKMVARGLSAVKPETAAGGRPGTFPAADKPTARRGALRRTHKGSHMSFSLSVGPVVALIAGILILIIPRLLNYIIALYLIILGVLGLMGEPRGRIGADANDTPPASVQRVIPADTGPLIEI